MSNTNLSGLFKEMYADSLEDLFNNFKWDAKEKKLYYQPITFSTNLILGLSKTLIDDKSQEVKRILILELE